MRICVIGAGGWGTALAVVLAKCGHRVVLWGHDPVNVEEIKKDKENKKYLPGVQLPDGVGVTADMEESVDGAEFVFLVVPVQYMRGVLEGFKAYHRDAPVVCCSKGLERETLLFPSGVIKEILGGVEVSVLSGPSHAEEVGRGVPTAVVVGGEGDLSRRVQELFAESVTLRVYRSEDVVGVELCAALKNVVALAAGMCDGLGFGDNTKSALLARGLVEMARLGVKMGARLPTFFGLAGVGDLMTTSFSRYGRNRRVGEEIGRGRKLEDVLSGMHQVAEGVWTVVGAVELARRFGVEMPITQKVYEVLYGGKRPSDAVLELMRRPLKAEWEGLLG